MSFESLSVFHPLTARWFLQNLGAPTKVQEGSWPAIAAGENTLVSAPTGTGKTLSAFLVFLDRLKEQAREGTLKHELQVIYISPLKSLAGDIRENLKKPLNGILKEEREAGCEESTPFDLKIAIRTGDTTQSERRTMIKTPPHILITTPESLYLLLTSKSGQGILKTAKAVIIDELHALIDSKRGAHLMLSLARLDILCKVPLQRIGLSATIEPLELAAAYLSPEPVTVVAPKMEKAVKIEVTNPLPYGKKGSKDPIWEEIAAAIFDYCLGTKSVIAFVEGRRYAEKLAFYINQLGGEGFARTHHGSLSKEQRLEVETSLRNGDLRLLCATSSMELGIDVGEIDEVFQIGCPRSISSTLQRLGRAGHNPGRVSVMHIFPRASSEGLYCGLTAEVARQGGVEYAAPPRLCFDVLAQHLVSMATGDGYSVDEVMEITKRAYPFSGVSKEDVKDILSMLAGDYEHERDLPVRPRLLYDRIHERVEGDAYSRMLAISAGGTIPDRGLYTVRTEGGVKLGELDEEFIFESRVGERFLLGTFAWKIVKIDKDTVVVSEADTGGAKLPFWKGEIKGRGLRTGLAFGKLFKRLMERYEEGKLYEELLGLGLNEPAAKGAEDFLKHQIEITGILPDDTTILVEHFRDSNGSNQLMVHSVFGRKVNAPLAILAQHAAVKMTGMNIGYCEDDDGFLLFPYGTDEMPEGVLKNIHTESARAVLEAALMATPLFHINFRYNTARALMMGVKKSGRTPLWLQRMRSADMLDSLVKKENHPLIRETKRECLEDYWDMDGVEYLLSNIRSGQIKVVELQLDMPSPMSLPFRQQTEAAMMYDYAPTTKGIYSAVEDALKQAEMISPSKEELRKVSERNKLPEDEKQLHSLLMIEGDLIAGELDIPIEWLETLIGKEQVLYIEPGLWIAKEQEENYKKAIEEAEEEERLAVIRRLLRYRGPLSAEEIAERYLFTGEDVFSLLTKLCGKEEAVEDDGLYYHAALYDKARKETIKKRREQVKTQTEDRYTALLTEKAFTAGTKEVQLEYAVKQLKDIRFAPALWEGVLFPARVPDYREEQLDKLLSQGNYFWRFQEKEGLSFHSYEDIDWEAPLEENLQELSGKEKIVYEALLKRGASFMQRFRELLNGESPFEVLLSMAEKGLVCADSFQPIRWWQNREKLLKVPVRQRVGVYAKAMTTGRWELVRPLKSLTREEELKRLFDRSFILSRETVSGMSWGEALEHLRIGEYTGQFRRGYFIKGLSGVQFIRKEDFEGILYAMEHPKEGLIWLPAIDPAQPYGKCLAHQKEKAFLNVPGTLAALKTGVPVAVMERQGKVFKVFDRKETDSVLETFVRGFHKKRLFPGMNRLLVKEYPKELEETFKEYGFKKEMQDLVLYRE
ncbi:DEAD/DEAH box helicase [Anaerocolumna xylanovorans]|uniref:ATP dependent helicase, Lhr family n=1 Tax=Anaerocolumna xylanovorans DSM 12503 TaxID=1121345 RepID=A0A1M7Y555_9FIRM|nr:DEAD/DEAH box helicase [Anaerocolumna xylanovorans]SHO47463.1 ATP dependent helicase, Lhr family [Anaerocolumna xylanovorans DSM 12503]